MFKLIVNPSKRDYIHTNKNVNQLIEEKIISHQVDRHQTQVKKADYAFRKTIKD